MFMIITMIMVMWSATTSHSKPFGLWHRLLVCHFAFNWSQSSRKPGQGNLTMLSIPLYVPVTLCLSSVSYYIPAFYVI